MNEIFVTNKNDFPHEDGYNGERFFFMPGERVTITLAAAQHMFGLGLKDKTDALLRLGWANDLEGPGRLAKFVFTEAQLVERPVTEKQAAAATAA